MLMQTLLDSKIGRLYLLASKKGLQGVFWTKQKDGVTKSLRGSASELKILSKAVRQLKEYFAGRRKRFSLPLDLSGTPFQKRVWKELTKIPHGKTRSYQAIALRINNPKAVRAVGSANGKNPFCVIVPCHRVKAADGSLGGYSGGSKIKKRLLRLEKIKLR